MFLETLRIDLKKNLEKVTSQNQDIDNVQSNLSAQDLMQPILQLPVSQRLVLADAITESIRQESSLSQK